MDKRDRYLMNPHIRLDKKRREQLGIDTNELVAGELEGVAIELDDLTPLTHKEVIIRKKRRNGSDKSPTTETDTL